MSHINHRQPEPVFEAVIKMFADMDESAISPEEARFIFSYMPAIRKEIFGFCYEEDSCRELALWDDVLQQIDGKQPQERLVGFLLSKKVQPGVMAVAYGVRMALHGLVTRKEIKEAIYYLSQGRDINDFKILLNKIAVDQPWVDILKMDVENRPPFPVEEILQHEAIVQGRVASMRIHKNVIFCNLVKQQALFQLCFEADLERVEKYIKTGDYLEVSGTHGITKKGNEALFVKNVVRHVPNQLPDRESFIDLWQEKSAYFTTVDKIRKFMTEQAFFEVITPVLCDHYEGGESRPYVTYENHAKATNYLRVTSEVTILKYLAGGAEKLFEIGPSFRNENSHGRAAIEFNLFEAYSVVHGFDQFYELMLQLICSLLPNHAEPVVIDYMKVFSDLDLDVHALSDLKNYALSNDINVEGITCPIEASRVIFKKQVAHDMSGIVVINNIPGKGSPYIKGVGEKAKRSWLIIDGLDVAEISENEINYADFSEKIRQQFVNDDQFVLRNSEEIERCLLSGLPPVVGIGLGVARLNSVIQKSST